MNWLDEHGGDRRAAIIATLDSDRGKRHRDYADGNRDFAAWLLVADMICFRRLGVSIFDLSDWSWRGAYDARTQPANAVREAAAADDTLRQLLGGS
ncbi:hypothetical protein Aca07nite_84490 [Actinoplanes capillaceus]|uniref:Uncharacterized protein n=1 Tax=Actinoplanes campanulatus TaxID=113559 RepID=A0ABQ3WY27_9ACTN|nr:hypothetical protein [Actinoplanes capillaceus]GID51174.1 hypothetical protein Aca07nite_84490 [Actinoplanes capillaceus]